MTNIFVTQTSSGRMARGKRIAEAIAIGIYAENTGQIGTVHGKAGEPEWRVEREDGNDEENAVRLKLLKKEVKSERYRATNKILDALADIKSKKAKEDIR